MANNLNFKFGQFSNLPTNKTPGTIYVTTDEQAMYIDLPKSHEANAEVARIRIGDIIVKNNVRDIQPPYSTDAFYYCSQENALLKWDGTKWKQINATAEAVTGALENLEERIIDEEAKSATFEQNIQDLLTAVGSRVTSADFEAFKSTNSTAIATAKQAGDDALAYAKSVESKADNALAGVKEAKEAAQEAKGIAESKVTMADVTALNYATKTEAAKYAADVMGKSTDDVNSTTVHGVKKLAESIDGKLDALDGVVKNKITMADVTALNYATKTEAAQYASNVMGKSTDTAASTTVIGVQKLATQALNKANEIDGLSGTVAGVNSLAVEAKEIADAALARSGGTMTGSINMGEKAITNLADISAASDGKMAANKNYVDAAVAAGIKANDAMTFKGVVGDGTNAIANLPNTAQKGDTYKVNKAGTYAGIPAKIGDLFINMGEDDKTAVWTHISSGYEDDYLQKLVVEDNTIQLTDGISNSVGSFKVVADGKSNLSFAVSTAANGIDHTITGTMVWGTF